MPPGEERNLSSLKDDAAILTSAFQSVLADRKLTSLRAQDLSVLAEDISDATVEENLASLLPENTFSLASQIKKAIGGVEEGDNSVVISKVVEILGEWTPEARRAAAARRRTAAARTIAAHPSRWALGSPIGSLVEYKALGRFRPQPQIKYSQQYEYGEIRMGRVNTLDKEMGEVYPCTYYTADIFIAAVKCFGTDDPGGIFDGGEGEDEPYLLITVANPTAAACDDNVNVVRTWKSPIFTEIERGDLFCLNQLVFQDVVIGRHGIILKIALMDNEHGSAEQVRRELEEQGARIAQTVKDAVALLTGVNIDEALANQSLEDNLLDTLGDITLGGLTELLKDDKIDEKQWQIPASVLRGWVDNGTYQTSGVEYPPSELPSHIDTNYPFENIFDRTWLFSGGGGSYKVYLRVIPRKVMHEYKPNA